MVRYYVLIGIVGLDKVNRNIVNIDICKVIKNSTIVKVGEMIG